MSAVIHLLLFVFMLAFILPYRAQFQSASETCKPIVDEERALWLSVFPMGLSILPLFPQIYPQSCFYLTFPLMGSGTIIESLQLGGELRRHKISEGIAIPLNMVPVMNK